MHKTHKIKPFYAKKNSRVSREHHFCKRSALFDINFSFFNAIRSLFSNMELQAAGVVNKKRCHTLDPDYKVTLVPHSKVLDSRVTSNNSPDRERWWPQKRHQSSASEPIIKLSDRPQRIFSQPSLDKRSESHRSADRNKSFSRGKRRDFLNNDPCSRRYRTKPSSASPLRFANRYVFSRFFPSNFLVHH